MASRELEILLTLKDKASAELKTFNTQVEALNPTFKKMVGIGTAGFAAIATAIGVSVKETIEAEAAQNRLTQILRTSRDASDAQINSLLKQADALEKVGVVSADSIVQAQAQLATFDLQAESIERLIPSILDYVVAEKGAAATTDDLKQLTNGLAQALQGNFGSLTRTGFVLDEATKALIENGTEAERTAALVDVLNSTYKGFNESARNTTEGALVVMRNEFNNLKQTIGDAFLPVLNQTLSGLTPLITKVTEWAQANPELVRSITLAAAAVSGFLVLVGALGLAIPAIVAGFTALASPVGLVVIGVTALSAAIAYLITQWDKVKAFLQDIGLLDLFRDSWQRIVDTFNNFLLPSLQSLWESFEPLKPFFEAMATVIGVTLLGAIVLLVKSLEGLINLFQIILSLGAAIGQLVSGVLTIAFKTLEGLVSGLIDLVMKLAGWLEKVFNRFSSIGNIASSIGKFIGGKITGVNDAIIAPNGNIITTHPDDYLIATKDPKSLGGGGVIVNVYGDVSGQELIDKVSSALSIDIKRQLRMT